MTLPGDTELLTDWNPHTLKTLVIWSITALSAFSLCIFLGNWQLRRRDQKQSLNHAIYAHAHAAPVAAPGPMKWSAANLWKDRYRHVRVTGQFVDRDQTLVHGTSRLGYGYWVMTPIKTSRGFFVFVNRGYIPGSIPDTMQFRSMSAPRGMVTVTGYLRLTEPLGGFLRPNRPKEGQWYSRDVLAIAASLHLPHSNVAPYFIDADASAQRRRWPVAGLTVTHFRNNHLSYAVGWFVLAAAVLVAAGLSARQEWRSRRRRDH